MVHRDLVLVAEVVRYKRERWVTPEGQTIIAPLPVGVAGGFGPGVRRFCLALHTQGQVTTERLTDLLNGIGLAISKREVVRLLTTDLEAFAQEDRAVLQAGLVSSPYLTVDDTGARHARRPGGVAARGRASGRRSGDRSTGTYARRGRTPRGGSGGPAAEDVGCGAGAG